MYGNTVGSRSIKKVTEHAYIAGFLDGDGSIMLQVKKRNDTNRGFRFMATICLYQDTRHEQPLLWMRNVFGVGYVSRRRDGMSELRINGFSRVRDILRMLQPYIRFKELQVMYALRALDILAETPVAQLHQAQLRELVDLVVALQNENYSAKRKR